MNRDEFIETSTGRAFVIFAKNSGLCHDFNSVINGILEIKEEMKSFGDRTVKEVKNKKDADDLIKLINKEVEAIDEVLRIVSISETKKIQLSEAVEKELNFEYIR